MLTLLANEVYILLIIFVLLTTFKDLEATYLPAHLTNFCLFLEQFKLNDQDTIANHYVLQCMMIQ